MANDFYDTLWVSKWADGTEIKKAYRKKAMQYHPDRNKWDAWAEKKFKEINEAYSTLSDSSKRKQYDTFGSAWWNPFWWGASWFWWWGWWAWFSWFEDLFWKGSTWSSSSWWVDMEDLFWSFWWASSGWFWGFWWSSTSSRQKPKTKPKPESLDFEKIYEVPIFDMILGCKIEVKWVYGQIAKLTIPASTKPWTKFRVKYYWKSEWTKKWHLIVKIEAKMPKHISDMDKGLLERIRDWVGY